MPATRPAAVAALLLAAALVAVAPSLTAAAPGADAPVHASADLTVTGTVTAGGRPLAGANVSVDGTAIGTATDAAGRFSLAGVPDDTEALRVTAAGYAPSVEPLRGRRTIRVALASAPVEVAVTGGGSRDDEARFEGSLSPPPPPSPPALLSAPVSPSGAARSATTADGASGSAAGAPRPADDAAESTTVEGDEPVVRPRRPAPSRGLLTAGDVDDGLNWDAFLRYVRRTLTGDGQRRSSDLPDLDLDRRVTLHVVDAGGRPVAGARVRIDAEGGRRARRLITETGTDGRLAIFPAYDFGADVRRLRVTASAPGRPDQSHTAVLTRLGGDEMVRLELPTRRAERPNALDLAFVIDATGSMGDELGYLTREFSSIVRRVEAQHPGVDLRFGLVAYRDAGDDYVVRRWDFTRSAQEMQQRLSSLSAGGGGDYPEAMDQALDAALDLDWRTGTAARIAFLVADAPPHAEAYEATMAHVREARARGLRVYPLAASGVADEAEYLMRATAALTQARHLFLTDDSGVGNRHAEPKIPCYQVTALDDLLVRVVDGELAGRRVEASSQSIVRSVGRQVAGVCEGGDAVTQQVPDQSGRRSGDLGYDD